MLAVKKIGAGVLGILEVGINKKSTALWKSSRLDGDPGEVYLAWG